VSDFIKFVKSSPLSAGSKGIWYPGEMEKDMEAKLRKDGIAVEDSVWKDITGLIEEYGIQSAVGTP
jgi:uncharacterized oxidoreductase